MDRTGWPSMGAIVTDYKHIPEQIGQTALSILADRQSAPWSGNIRTLPALLKPGSKARRRCWRSIARPFWFPSTSPSSAVDSSIGICRRSRVDPGRHHLYPVLLPLLAHVNPKLNWV
jgi:hypothetical protein